jgi:multidrug resistance efflux pump
MSLLIEDDYPEPVDPQQAAGSQRGWPGRRPWQVRPRRAAGWSQPDRAAARHLLIGDDELDPGADGYYPEEADEDTYVLEADEDRRYPDDDDEDTYYPETADRRQHTEGLRRYVTTPQRLGGILLAAASVLAVTLYVPSVLAADRHSFTGVVSSSAIASLNFGTAGRVGKVTVHLGQAVQKGQVLATEAGSASMAALRADRAAVAADKANLTALEAESAPAASVATVEAELASDRVRRAVARTKVLAAEILAPAPGTVVAIYGQPGEAVTPAGLRSSAGSGQAVPGQQPRFALLPSGPMASLKSKNGLTPVIALRTSGGWQVRLLIPQSSISGVQVGQKATISVPAAQLSGVRGTVAELSPTPVSTSGGASYEAVVGVQGHTAVAPLSGMSANVQLEG